MTPINFDASKIAVIIKTCEGRPSLLWALQSIKHGLQDSAYRIYISDEEPLDEWKKPVYDLLEDQGHHIEVQKNGIGCGEARNRLVDSLEDEELVLRMDDDFELGGEFNISALESVLKVSNEIAFCADYERQIGSGKSVRSGSIRPAGGDFVVSPPKLIKKFHGPFKKHRKKSNIRYSIAEHTRNLLLLKRGVLEEVKWNEQLMFWGEHEEFMMSIRDYNYKGAYTPDSTHYHRDDLASYRFPDIERYSPEMEDQGRAEMKDIFIDRWNCNTIVSRYPISWYMIEAGRRVMDGLLA